MQVDIREKLQNHLLKDSFEESDVVYILSRIRKLIDLDEIDMGKGKYEKLKFFCNWALHVQIDNLTSVSDLLIEVKDGSKPTIAIFRLFYDELVKFLNDCNLRTSIFTSNKMEINFVKKLSEVYKDTPLIIKKDGKKWFTFTITESDIGIGSWGSTFRIESHLE